VKVSKHKLYYIVAAGVIFACVIGFYARHNLQTSQTMEDMPLVRTKIINSTEASPDYTYAGEVRGRYESQLAFQINGKIIKRNVELGSVVSKGDLLFEIDPKDVQQTVNSHSAQVYSAESQLRLAESNFNRYQKLYEENAISRAQLDQYQNAYDVALAAVRQASAQYAHGANQLEYSLLYADKPGVIAAISAEVGQVIAAGQTVVTLVEDGEQEVEISVSENRIENLRKSSQIKITFWALPNIVAEGKIREVSPMADKGSRTYKVRVSLLNPPPEVKLGMTSSVVVTGSGKLQDALYIPLSAIYQTKETPSVWVVNADTVSLKAVGLGAYINDQVQVINGLNPGDIIVTAGIHKLREGQRVRAAGGSI
jgi:multidrug efflux system membrane fusion protein